MPLHGGTRPEVEAHMLPLAEEAEEADAQGEIPAQSTDDEEEDVEAHAGGGGGHGP